MSYSIIFETKIVKLSDGRILHLSLDGCNNDNAGRRRDEFHGTLYETEEAFREKIASYKKDSVPGKNADWFDLKIHARWCTFYDYGVHLEKMLSRALTWEELKEGRLFCYGIAFDGVTHVKSDGTRTHYTPQAWNKVFYDWTFGKMPGEAIYHRHNLYTEDEIVDALDNHSDGLQFRIERKTNRRILERRGVSL